MFFFFFHRLFEMDTNGLKEDSGNGFEKIANYKEDYNPWAVSSIFDFNYFCCPECDCKSQSKQDFVDHISSFHTWVS